MYLNPTGTFKPSFFLAALNIGPISQYLDFSFASFDSAF